MVFQNPHETAVSIIVDEMERRCRHWEDYVDAYHALDANEPHERLIPAEVTKHNQDCSDCKDKIQQAFGSECMGHYAKPNHVTSLPGLRLSRNN